MPRGVVTFADVKVERGKVDNANRAVAGMRAGFRRCYERELESNPNAKGAMTLTVQLGPNGEVTGVTSTETGDLGGTIGCCKARAMSAQFAAPSGGDAQVVIPIRCEPRT